MGHYKNCCNRASGLWDFPIRSNAYFSIGPGKVPDYKKRSDNNLSFNLLISNSHDPSMYTLSMESR